MQTIILVDGQDVDLLASAISTDDSGRQPLKIYLAPTAQDASNLVAQHPNTITIEAEYGDSVVDGSIYTAAHHGDRQAYPAPCVDGNLLAAARSAYRCGVTDMVVVVSHVDLDTLGGIARICSASPFVNKGRPGSFWAAAAYVDVHGAHKLGESGASPGVVAALEAWWAWNALAREKAPEPAPGVRDVTHEVNDAFFALDRIFGGDAEMLAAGKRWREKLERLDRESFVEQIGGPGGVIVRVSAAGVNALYRDASVVVAYNTATGAITISECDGGAVLDCCAVARGLWGEAAGGKAGIAGSPRNQRMTLADLENAVCRVCAALWGWEE